MVLKWWILVPLHCIAITLIYCQFTSAISSDNFPLPTNILPTKYLLHINTLIHQNVSAYNGSVAIDLIIREPTNLIVLNILQLQLFNLSLTNVDSGFTLAGSQLKKQFVEEKEQLHISWPLVPLKLQIGQRYRLTIGFIGKIQEEELFGLFRSTYLDEKNNSIPIATTQFEPTSARLAFPCFDEPPFKAKFVISITHGSNYTAISNMPAEGEPVLSSSANGPMKTTTFLETPTMSTYIVAFAITNYNKTTFVSNGLEHRSFFPPNSKDNGSRALENSVKTISALEKHLGIKFHLPKLDQLQIGKSYGRAMENWGLIVFTKKDILSSEKDYNKLDLLDMINVQNHEIAHQWFGNLVTPKSWTFIWLKEALSTYYSYVAANLVYPEKDIFEYFIIHEVSFVYSTQINNPLSNPIKVGADIKKNLGIVTYKYGGSMIRMFDHAIGQSTFQKGISKYLMIFQYSVADEDDFFGALQAAVDEDEVAMFQNNQSVSNIMKTWTHNQGVPIIKIIRNYDTGTITIRQKSNTEENTERWWIPLNFATATNPDFDRTIPDYIMPPQDEVTLDLQDLNISLSNSDWLIVNKQQTGIFYVVYDDLNLKIIAEALSSDHKRIHVFNRALIFRDLSVTFDEELDAIEPLLSILQYLDQEEASLPWMQAIELIFKLMSRLQTSEALQKFKHFIYDKFIGMFERKYQNNSQNLTATDLKMKENVARLNFEIDTLGCQNYTTDFPKQYFFGERNDLKTPCALSMCLGIKNATLKELETIFSRIIQLDSNSVEFHQLKVALRCLESDEHVDYMNQLIFPEDFQTEEFLEPKIYLFLDLVTSNLFFRAGFARLNKTKMNPQELAEFFVSVDGEKNLNTKKGEEFLKKYETNINAWLENYENVQKLRTTS